jgi:thioredoxin reductase
LKDRNAKRIAEYTASRKLEVLFNSQPTEFREGVAVVEVGGELRELPNDFVWILAGGTPPSEFLKAAGVAFGVSNTAEQLATK